MPSFTTADGVTLAYDDVQPPGPPERTLVLLHGFASNRNEGWKRTGWYTAFQRRGMRAIVPDTRGHGESGKLHDAAAYARSILAADVLSLMDHLDLQRVDLFGYSMGAYTAMSVALAAPERLSNLILGGIGEKFLDTTPRDSGPMTQAMLADDPDSIDNPMLRSFRQFADEQGEDRQALAAASASPRLMPDLDGMAALAVPVLVVAGARDHLAGDPDGLARAFGNGKSSVVPGTDHFSAIPHGMTKAAVFDFLDGMMDDGFPSGF